MINEPIRILHVFGRMDRGGAETFVMNIYRNIDHSKVQFDFMVHTTEECAYDNEIEQLGGKIYRVSRYKGINHFKYKREWALFFENNTAYKIIHGHVRSTASIYLRTAKKFGLHTIAHSHSTSSGKGISAIVKNIMQYCIRYIADSLFACSKFAGTWLYGDKFCRKSNFHVIPNSIDTEKFMYNQSLRMLKRKELNIENKFVIGHIGRFVEVKNHNFLIDIFAEIYKRNTDAVLLLVGDGELREEIENKIDRLGLKNSVILTGVRSDINELLQATEVFLFPSLWEGLPVTLIEAQASGLHCIASDSITEEAKITDLVEYISLKKPASYWAEKALRYANGYERKNMRETIKNAGFDVKEVAKWLEQFYSAQTHVR